MGERNSPPFRRRRLGKILRELREEVGLTQWEACDKLEFSAPRLSRMESGETAPEPVVLKGMLDVYGVPSCDWDAYLQLARDARKKGRWQAYGLDAMGYVAMEEAAESVRSFSLAYVPGLLQTEEYIRAVLGDAPLARTKRKFENEVKVRLIRQRRLTDDSDLLELNALVDEGALRRPVGGAQVMRAQLHRIAALVELPNVTLRVVPTSVGHHSGMMSAFTLLNFADAADGDVAYVEHAAGSLEMEKSEQIRACTLRFDRVLAKALSPEESVALIERVAGEM